LKLITLFLALALVTDGAAGPRTEVETRNTGSTVAVFLASTGAVASLGAAATVGPLQEDPTYCWAYEDPPPDCLDGVEGGGGYVEESTTWPWPEQFDVLCAYKGHAGVGGVGRVSGSQYVGVCFASGGCFVEFEMELSFWEAVAIWGHVPILLQGNVTQENGC
jgi:hypothetical protein